MYDLILENNVYREEMEDLIEEKAKHHGRKNLIRGNEIAKEERVILMPK
jgi:hypothetical protein